MHLTHSPAHIASGPGCRVSIDLMQVNRHFVSNRDMCEIRSVSAHGRLVTVDDCWQLRSSDECGTQRWCCSMNCLIVEGLQVICL